MTIFGHIPIMVKGTVGTLLAIGSLVYVGLIALDRLENSGQQMQTVQDEVLPSLGLANELVTTASTMELELFRLTTWAMTGVKGEALERQFERTTQAQETFTNTVARLPESEAALLQPLIEAYLPQANQAIQMMRIDPRIASAMLNGANIAFGELDTEIQRLGSAKNQAASVTVSTLTAAALSTKDEVTRYAIMAAAGGLLMSLLVNLTISQPIRRMTKAMQAATNGEFDRAIPCRGHRNELGRMANALAVFQSNAKERSERNLAMQGLQDSLSRALQRAGQGDFSHRLDATYAFEDMRAIAQSVNTLLENLETVFHETGAVLTALANADLTRRMNGKFEGQFDRLRQDADRACDRLAALVDAIRTSSEAARHSTETIAAQSDKISEQMIRQAASLEEASAALRDITGSMQSNSENCSEAATLARKSRSNVERGQSVATNAVAAVQAVNESADKISEIVTVIESIAFSTNLLALNASVEAARAGEAGKGFSIVAGEVRQLAQRTSEAASSIADLIAESIDRVGSGVKNVEATHVELTQIGESFSQLDDLIARISETSLDQVSTAKSISGSMSELEEATVVNASATEQGAASAQTLVKLVSDLDEKVSTFKADRGARSAQNSGQAA